HTAHCSEQTTSPLGTPPFAVGTANVHTTVSTTFGDGCWSVIVADVNARSVISSVQLAFGQSGAPGIRVWGAFVVSENARFPFLIALAGNAWLPVTVICARFWAGDSLPPCFVQVEVTLACAARVMTTSPFPKRARDPVPLSCRPRSLNE